jgi:hypothetical protein
MRAVQLHFDCILFIMRQKLFFEKIGVAPMEDKTREPFEMGWTLEKLFSSFVYLLFEFECPHLCACYCSICIVINNYIQCHTQIDILFLPMILAQTKPATDIAKGNKEYHFDECWLHDLCL